MPHRAPSVKAEVSAALALLRDAHQRGATLRQLADAVGVDHTTVGRWVRGERPPTGQNLEGLLAWAGHRGARTVPPDGLTSADAKGIRYAAEVMAATLADVLRTARLLEEPRDPIDVARQAASAALAESEGAGE